MNTVIVIFIFEIIIKDPFVRCFERKAEIHNETKAVAITIVTRTARKILNFFMENQTV